MALNQFNEKDARMVVVTLVKVFKTAHMCYTYYSLILQNWPHSFQFGIKRKILVPSQWNEFQPIRKFIANCPESKKCNLEWFKKVQEVPFIFALNVVVSKRNVKGLFKLFIVFYFRHKRTNDFLEIFIYFQSFKIILQVLC